MKKWVSILTLIFLIFGIIGCSNGNSSSKGSSDSNKKYKIKIGHVNPPGEPTHDTFLEFVKPELEKRSNGRFEVEIYPQSQLGSENEMLEQVKIGTLQVSSASAPANHSEKLNVFYLPYLFPEQQQLWDVLDGPIGEEINKDFEAKAGVKVVGWWSTGIRHFFSTKGREIRSIDDVQGMKIRVMEQPVLMEIFKDMGMLPTPLPYGEVYGSIATHVVDGAENDPSGYKNMKFYEVGPNLSLSSHIAYPKVISMNPKFYNDLPDDLKKVVDDVFAEAQVKQRQMFMDVMDKDIKWLKDNGVNVIEDVDIESFKKKAEPLWRKVKGIDTDLLDRILESRK